jgi:hypothetical protein
VRAGMRLHGFHRGFYDRAVEIVCHSPALRSLFDGVGRGLDSPHQVEAEVGPVIISAPSSGHTTSKRSNTVRISSSSSNPSRLACRAKWRR